MLICSSETFCEICQPSHSSRTHKVTSKPVVQKVAAVSNLARKFEQFQLEPETDDAEAPPVPPPMPPPSVPKPASKRSDRVVGILKKQGAPTNSVRRVQFDPLALLLDASLEGEIDLVKKVIDKVPNPSSANDEGITALHNSVCAGYFDVVKFLVHWGVDINAADSDGWTPLHCAASCNSVQMVKFLVENGAQIFAETYSDHETAAEKCEELDEGYAACSDYLYGTQEKLGTINKGSLYTLFDYTAEHPDELSFKEGDLITVQRRGDNGDIYWWWSRHSSTGKEGFVPRNYLGMWPRIKPARDPMDRPH